MKSKNILHTIIALFLGIVMLASCGKKNDFDYLQDASKSDKGLDSTYLPVDTSRGTVDKSKYLQASVFPGLVCAEEPRITKTINLDLFYVKSEDLRINVLPRPQFSTGFYAAPGELVTITIPDGVYELVAQIGAWTDYVGHLENPQRDPVIYSRTKLVPGKNYMRNLYGGHIYIIPSSPQATPVPITFDNVVESPDFVLGVSDPVKWKQKVAASCVPQLELRSKYMIFTVRKDYVLRYPIADPVALMTEWDRGIKQDFFAWTGLVENAADPRDQSPQLPYRIVLDVSISAGYGHNGFPIMAINDFYWQTTITDIANLRNSDVWGLYHEIGHNFQQTKHWSWPAVGETTNNLFIYHLSKRMSEEGLGTWPAKHPATRTAMTEALAFAASNDADKDFDLNPDLGPFHRLTPFLQMFDNIPADWGYPGQGDGWGIMTELYKRSRRAIRQSSTTLAKHDFVYETVSDYTRKDWQIFFSRWGITLSSTAISRVDAKGYPLLLQEIWKYDPYTRTGGDAFLNPYGRNNWSIIAFSSEETGNTPPSNGLAAGIIDGDLSTFWHSKWRGGAVERPYTIDIDLSTLIKAPITISGFKYAHRQGVLRPAIRVNIEVSNDKTNWTAAPGSPFTLAAVNGFQTFNFLSTVKTRYLRIKYNAQDIRDDPHCALAEFEVFK